MRPRALAVVALLVLGGCSDPNRFDLQCHLTQHLRSHPDQKFEDHYRVDLKTMRWCTKDCKETHSVKGLTDDLLTFDSDDSTSNIGGQITLHTRFWHRVNRRTGAYDGKMFTHIGPGDLIEGEEDGMASADGQCEKIKFSGFPAKRF